MVFPVHTPRVNNNDDQVRFIRLLVETGQAVRAGDALAEVETEKAVFQVDAEGEGYVISVAAQVGEMIDVGSVLLWMGTSAEEQPPQDGQEPKAESPKQTAEPTAKARALIQQYGLEGVEIAAQGNRLTAEDVERHVAQHGLGQARTATAAPVETDTLRALAPGPEEPLGPEQRGMLRNVLWHRDEAVPAYLELKYDAAAWKRYAESFAQQHKLLLSPLLALMAHQLARIAMRQPKINSVIVGERRRRYSQVNLGFTVQAGETLYLAVVQQAGETGRLDFVRALSELQRKALAHKLVAQELQGATVGFTSMERWQVSRHMPILPPHVSLMVAHTADAAGNALLGATYDHRLLTGGDAVSVLRQLAVPLADDEI